MDLLSTPELASNSQKQRIRDILLVVALIIAMILISILGAIYWQPETTGGVMLELSLIHI